MTDTPSCPHDSVGVITAMGLITFRRNLCSKTCYLLLVITDKCSQKIEIQGGTFVCCVSCICMCMQDATDAEMVRICNIFKLQVTNCGFSVSVFPLLFTQKTYKSPQTMLERLIFSLFLHLHVNLTCCSDSSTDCSLKTNLLSLSSCQARRKRLDSQLFRSRFDKKTSQGKCYLQSRVIIIR